MILPCFSVSSADEVLETGGRLYICLILACFAMYLALRMVLPCFSVSSADEVLETGGGGSTFRDFFEIAQDDHVYLKCNALPRKDTHYARSA